MVKKEDGTIQLKRNNMSETKKPGGTKVGNALRMLASQGKTIAPVLLSLAGSITGLKGLTDLADKIKGSDNISDSDKEYLIQQVEYDMQEMQEITKRWESDMNSDSFLSKNIRPLTLAFLTLTLFMCITLDSSLEGFKVDKEWIGLLSSLLLLVYGAYFGARTAEKIAKKRKE